MPTPISAVIITKNESANLPGCLASLDWADERLVVDSFSSDNTVDLARQAGARVIQHTFTNYAAQRNFAQAQAAHDWVLCIDADERVSLPLRDEIQGLAKSAELARHLAYHIQRVHLISGRWFTHPPDRASTPALRQALRRLEVPRLYDRRQATWKRALHEEVHVPEPHGVLDGVICHYSATNLSAALETFNAYSDLEAAYLHRQLRRPVSLWEAVARGARTFTYHYFWQRWFRYGENGMLMALSAAMSKYMNYAKLWERQRIAREAGEWTEADRALLQREQVDDKLSP
jgi:glycosyltransferase involved in cell wall biosynthesis